MSPSLGWMGDRIALWAGRTRPSIYVRFRRRRLGSARSPFGHYPRLIKRDGNGSRRCRSRILNPLQPVRPDLRSSPGWCGSDRTCPETRLLHIDAATGITCNRRSRRLDPSRTLGDCREFVLARPDQGSVGFHLAAKRNGDGACHGSSQHRVNAHDDGGLYNVAASPHPAAGIRDNLRRRTGDQE